MIHTCINIDGFTIFTEILVKELDKRASGQAFEVILAPDAKGEIPLPPPKEKKEMSLEVNKTVHCHDYYISNKHGAIVR